MNFTQLYPTTLITEMPGIINNNFLTVGNYLDVFYDGVNGIIISPVNTPGRVKGGTGEFVTLTVDNLIVKSQYTNLYENITTANYDYYITNLGLPVVRRNSSTWEDPDSLYIDVEKPYYKLIPSIGAGDYTALRTDLKSQFVQLILDPSGATIGEYKILLNPTPPITGSSYLSILLDPSLSEAEQTKWVQLICTDYDASYGSAWEVYEFGDGTAGGGSGGGGGVTPTWVNNQIEYYLLNYEYDPSIADSVTMPVAVGGLPAGTTAGSLRGQTYEQIITQILFATVLAYVNLSNSATLGSFATATMEVGYSYAPTTTATYIRGDIMNGDGTAGPNLTGNANQYNFKFPNGISDIIISAPDENTKIHAYTGYNITFGTNIWSVTVAYYIGTGTYTDNKGNTGTNLFALRAAGSTIGYSNTVTGRRYAWWGTGIASSEPTDSAGVRALSDKIFLDGSNTGTFDIVIPMGNRGVYFFLPENKTVEVISQQLVSVDVSNTFTVTDIVVDDAGGIGQAYESWVADIGGIGYTEEVTYTVTVT